MSKAAFKQGSSHKPSRTFSLFRQHACAKPLLWKCLKCLFSCSSFDLKAIMGCFGFSMRLSKSWEVPTAPFHRFGYNLTKQTFELNSESASYMGLCCCAYCSFKPKSLQVSAKINRPRCFTLFKGYCILYRHFVFIFHKVIWIKPKVIFLLENNF